MFNPFPVVLADYRRNRLLVATTMALVALAVAMGIAVIAQERALRQGNARAADDFDLLVGAPGSPTQLVLTSVYLKLQSIPLLSGEVLERISRTRGVRYAAPIAFGDNWQGHPIVGTITAFANRDGHLPPTEGRLFTQRGEAVVGASVPLALGTRIQPAHGQQQTHDEEDEQDEAHDHHHALSYTVVGRLPPRHNAWDSAILVPVEDVWAIHELPSGHAEGEKHIGPPWDATQLPGVPAIAVKPESVAAAYGLRGQLRTHESMALFPAEVLNELYSTLGNVRDLMSLLALTAQVLVVIAILMALLTGFLARARQFAVLRAIGASARYIFIVIWLEVSLLVAAGATLGLVLGYGASWLLMQWIAPKAGFTMPVSLGEEELRLVAALVAAGLLIALLPGWLSLRRSIAEGLKN
ncbi:MAG: ABC transporter permease [Candidatus Dactylopiibacterium carminicum]|uniref:ABC transporter permease n=1 Tax=Candidatus Dactylopiibacterium carminicum TaxID=857335 RepID=A0A272EP76_9RHOO|nr:ABC transporter permease [Candidatus Dactylopiibacterium carminicum]KAF7598288.1 ABC transporter permease [Candidatus Dactylopiibacterium carminicum]PAS91914.1 MAG: ABC transporter permease [Candidatus Dactylopiibacterium carminicum]PAS94970.1 MAG: ABC transporter permease [Candidatus Dactylopiibacterium carminicum]PAS97220.1 MAG: ABC transporter permease [Candidatus Dactylopiibacterium carminicum]